jgi:hypothetical protein
MSTNTVLRHHLGEPQLSGPLALYPIFGPQPRLRYRSLAHAVERGAYITELDGRASVNDVLITNASDQGVLLYEGELIAGAQQNRTIDQPVLIPAGAQLKVPVSCVEHGRWEDERHAEAFTVAPHAADPELRRTKRATANRRSRAGEEPRPEQHEVWHEVEQRLECHGVTSASAAFTDLFDAKRGSLDELKRPIRPVDGQLGAVVEIAGEPVALDLVSRPEAFADLLPRLLDGYGLQALQTLNAAVAARMKPSDEAALDFFELVLTSRGRWIPTPGMGDAFTPTRRRISGCGLRAGGELIALSAFPAKAA